MPQSCLAVSVVLYVLKLYLNFKNICLLCYENIRKKVGGSLVLRRHEIISNVHRFRKQEAENG